MWSTSSTTSRSRKARAAKARRELGFTIKAAVTTCRRRPSRRTEQVLAAAAAAAAEVVEQVFSPSKTTSQASRSLPAGRFPRPPSGKGRGQSERLWPSLAVVGWE